MSGYETNPDENHQTSTKKAMRALSPWNSKNYAAFICSKCERINLPELFSEELELLLWLTDGDGIFLEHQSLDDLDPECALCCILRIAWPHPDLEAPYSLTTHSRKDSCPGNSRRFSCSRSAFSGPEGPRWLHISGQHFFSRTRQTYYDTFNSIVEASTNALLDTRVNFRPLKAWIEYCCHNHGPECRADPDWNPVKGMNLIDVRNRSIVKATNHQVKYAALSYVWGIQKSDDDFVDRLPSDLPRTIDDALQATRELGLDYLWIDKYCIPQHNEEEKRSQINSMHRIYQQAFVTIVAAAGTGPYHGLPGISTPRTLPAHVLIDGRLFVGIPRHPLDSGAEIESMRWNTRAWTYQEKFFSRRMLYFTDSQVVFDCKGEYDGIEDPMHNHAHSEVPPLIHFDRPQYGPVNLYAASLWNHIREINKRQITYETDRVNTMAGIYSHLKAEGKIMGHLSGIPIWGGGLLPNAPSSISWEAGFLSGLAWDFRGGRSEGRRSEFPSWSWAGWKGCYDGDYSVEDKMVSVWFELQPDDSTVPVLAGDEVTSDRASPKKRWWQKRSPRGVFSAFFRVAQHITRSPPRSRTTAIRQRIPPGVSIPSQEFWPILESRGWRDSLCRFIHIEAPIVRFRCRMSRYWELASLEGYPINEDSHVIIRTLIQDEPQLKEALALETFRGLVFLENDTHGHSYFVIVLRDFACHSERIGHWRADRNLFVIPQGGNEDGSRPSLSDGDWDESVATDDFEEITGGRRERVRLG